MIKLPNVTNSTVTWSDRLMKRREFVTIDRKTGEEVSGMMLHIPTRFPAIFGDTWMQLNMSACGTFADDPRLTLSAVRVFFFLLSRVDYENKVRVARKIIAQSLHMKETAVSREIHRLLDMNLIEKNPDETQYSFIINRNFVWRGSSKNAWKNRKKMLETNYESNDRNDPDDKQDG